MSLWILSFIAMMIGLLTWKKEKTILHPVVLFELIWFLIIFLYKLHLRDYYVETEKTVIIMYLMLLMFPLGYYLLSKFYITSNRIRINRCNVYANQLRTYLFFSLCLVSAIGLFVNDIAVIRYLISGYNYLQLNRIGIGTEFLSSKIPLLAIYVIYPVQYFVSPICAIEFMSTNDRSKKRLFLIVNIIIIVLSLLDHGGRVHLMHMFICYVCALSIYKNDATKVSLKKNKKKIIIVLCLLVVAGVIASISRGIEDFGESIYSYLTCAIPHMTARLQTIEPYSTLGFYSFNGITLPIVLLLTSLGLISRPDIYLKAQEMRALVESEIVIGNGVHTNAFLPASCYFYIDFGYIGVIIGTMLLGAWCAKVAYRQKMIGSKLQNALYLMMMYAVFFSFIRLEINAASYVIGYIYILFLYVSDSKKN